MIQAEQLTEAFATNCPKKNWGARIIRVDRGGTLVEIVSFKDRQGLISLQYDCERGQYRRFNVIFEKALASWGDYNNAIAKGLQTVLTALQAGGLPFVAPASLDDIVVRTTPLTGFTTVEYEPVNGVPTGVENILA